MTMTSDRRDYRSGDGLRLSLVDHRPSRDDVRLPAVCLAGLTRSAADFGPLARALAGDPAAPRRVIAFDYRGRGESDHDTDWRYYDLATERDDFLRGLAMLGIERAHFIGTSRGGLHVMALAATHAAMIASAVYNDIGPVIEPQGLLRIKGYVGKAAAPADFAEAITLLRQGAAATFDGLTPEEWRHFAVTTFGEDESNLRLRYDPALARTLDAFDLTSPLPESWDLFDHLRGKPVLTLRGAHSDLLSSETVAAMEARWPGCETMIVAGQGHTPLLADDPSIERVRSFLLRADDAATVAQITQA